MAYDELVAEAAQWAPGAEGLTFLPYLAGERTPARRPRRARRLRRPGAAPRPRRARPRGAGGRGLRPARLARPDRRARRPARAAAACPAAARAAKLGCGSSRRCSSCRSSALAVDEGAAFGAALLGGVAGGLWAGADEAVAATVRPRETVEPVAEWVEPYARGASASGRCTRRSKPPEKPLSERPRTVIHQSAISSSPLTGGRYKARGSPLARPCRRARRCAASVARICGGRPHAPCLAQDLLQVRLRQLQARVHALQRGRGRGRVGQADPQRRGLRLQPLGPPERLRPDRGRGHARRRPDDRDRRRLRRPERRGRPRRVPAAVRAAALHHARTAASARSTRTAAPTTRRRTRAGRRRSPSTSTWPPPCAPHCKLLLVEANAHLGHEPRPPRSNRPPRSAPRQISNSYGGPEFPQRETVDFDQYYNHPGVAVIASSGDTGFGVRVPGRVAVRDRGRRHLPAARRQRRAAGRETAWTRRRQRLLGLHGQAGLADRHRLLDAQRSPTSRRSPIPAPAWPSTTATAGGWACTAAPAPRRRSSPASTRWPAAPAAAHYGAYAYANRGRSTT